MQLGTCCSIFVYLQVVKNSAQIFRASDPVNLPKKGRIIFFESKLLFLSFVASYKLGSVSCCFASAGSKEVYIGSRNNTIANIINPESVRRK
jgi:hypothetical protein